ncbi:MAG: hypothetical protein ABI452_05060 [Candidatus Limnocylindrales bacterium]
MAFNVQQFIVDLFGGLLAQDRARVEPLIHPDFVADIRQSGERSRGFEDFWAQFVMYPGSAPLPDIPQIRFVGDDERWAMSPGYTIVPLASPNDYTMITRTRYPDGSWWRVINLVQIRDDKLYRMENYFAPELPAPLAESIASWPRG